MVWLGVESNLRSSENGSQQGSHATRFGHVEGEGLFSLAGYSDLQHETPESTVAVILERLALNEGHPKDHYTKITPTRLAVITKPSTPNNLPPLYSFFGREKELKTIADALTPEARTWGALIDGPGGMGKTSLAVRAAELVPPNRFKQIIFLSAKERELTADGQRPLKGFVLPSYLQMLNELANQLGQPELAKLAEEERTLRLQQKLQTADALLILDNLESLSSEHRDQLFAFVGRLPHGCKAGASERGADLLLRGIGLRLKADYPAAITASRKALDLSRSFAADPELVSIVLNHLANAEKDSRDFDAAEGHYREALRLANDLSRVDGVAVVTSKLAELALDRGDLPGAQALAREALHLAESIHSLESIASICHVLAQTLMRQGLAAEAKDYAQRAVVIFTRLSSPDLEAARATLRECASLNKITSPSH